MDQNIKRETPALLPLGEAGKGTNPPARSRGRPRGSGHAKTGVYVRSPNGLKLRDRSVQRIVAKTRALCPWIQGPDLPLLRRWSELELHASYVHAALRKFGILNGRGEARRLLDEHRKLSLAQLAIGAELGLNPHARAQMQSMSRNLPIDIDAALERAQKMRELRDSMEVSDDADGKPT